MSDTITNLGKYNVVKEIDRGSMGIVYLGHDPYIDRPVAIKVGLAELLADTDSGEQYRKMFFNEAHTAGKLTHPNIINIYDAGVDDDTCYIVMELVEGGHTLKKHTKTGKLLPIEKVIEIAFKCAKALDYAHEQGVTHRDIKPSNILVTNDTDVKMCDFSIAHINKPDMTETQPSGLMGSPRYMSPEQLREEKLDNQTDIYSLGIVIYELLTGQHPFPSANFSELVEIILNHDAAPMRSFNPEIPEVLDEIVKIAIHKDKQYRYKTGLEMATDLNKAFENLKKPEAKIEIEEKFNLIKALDFFQGFPDTEVGEILNASTWKNYNKDENIIVEGELDDCFYIIITGNVVVKKSNKIIRTLELGDCFGEMGYLAKTERTASIIADKETSLLKINSTVISQVSLKCQVRFLKVFLRTLIHRLSATTEIISQDI
ncbi:MAG: serine/threonine protein kinase [Gammaproteobacteria bacterium]|jgi:serine/threonine protein kinase